MKWLVYDYVVTLNREELIIGFIKIHLLHLLHLKFIKKKQCGFTIQE